MSLTGLGHFLCRDLLSVTDDAVSLARASAEFSGALVPDALFLIRP